MIKNSIAYFFVFFLLACKPVFGCQCPLTTLSEAECDRYSVIFKGKVLSVKSCEGNLGEAVFEVEELYRGDVTKRFKVLFECNGECAKGFNAGEEWIIYSNYRQVSNVMMDWCSRSRKYFKIAREDYYTSTYGNDYDEEVTFLRKNLGLHKIAEQIENTVGEPNQRPDMTQTIILLVCSLSAMILFYWLFRKYFHKF
jgi:hypothetical protein